MAVDRVFAAAYIDNDIKTRILGRTLHPFCLWHMFLLQVIDSPFIANKDIELFDLKTAIGICSMHYPHSRVKRPIFPLFMNMKDLAAHVEKFMNYVGNYLSRPEYSIVERDSDTPNYPRALTHPPNTIITLFNAAKGANIPVDQAWNIPIGQAYVAEAMMLRMAGNDLDFEDEDKRQFEEELRKKVK